MKLMLCVVAGLIGSSAAAWAESACEPAWDKSKVYTGGQRVSHDAKRFEARWWTQGENPARSGQWDVWKSLGACPAEPQPVAAQLNVGGRVQADAPDRVSYSWPGVYFEGRFRGTGVGLVFDDAFGQYNVEIDGQPRAKVVKPGKTTYWISGLANGEHSVRVSLRGELTGSPDAVPPVNTPGSFGGLVAAPGGQLLAPPASPTRQIEFIGDSYTAGLGAESGRKDCTEEEVAGFSNADVSFGALTARHYGAAYQINGYSGLGMVRNYGGNIASVNYRTFYDRALTGVAGNVWTNPGNWKPQLVVVGLGINDFSTAVGAGEAYTPETLRTAYKSAYRGFIDKLRGQYGNVHVIVSATYLWPDNKLQEVAQEVVAEAKAGGDQKISYFYYDGLDSLGCGWHPSVRDHQAISAKLVSAIDGLGLWR
ncbi:GDSL-type esterase/lipase family protein [Jeongeupia sp. USM3]|uniref:GDSL-type esterase/lipase family protein n=1 Tax=Jeongeupia sp. USM3 TaxID=1906741 RepID=UPI00196B6F06|nr:GDSL-type esterase/lipase family protein [Jeongeupia sp. USM3]